MTDVTWKEAKPKTGGAFVKWTQKGMSVEGILRDVLESEGKLVFKADVAWKSPHGAEISGLYTAQDHRHRGHATLGLGQLSRQLLSGLPRLTLRGNEAVSRVALNVGYERRPEVQLLVTQGG